MYEQIIALKCKDGWYVKLIETRHVITEGEVLDLIRKCGLRVESNVESEDGNQKIVAG